METIDQHDSRVFMARGGRMRSNISCPVCGNELYYKNVHAVVKTNPPKMEVECKCGFDGAVLCP